MTSDLIIEFYQNTDPDRTFQITNLTVQGGSVEYYDWQVPSGFTPGFYIIRVLYSEFPDVFLDGSPIAIVL